MHHPKGADDSAHKKPAKPAKTRRDGMLISNYHCSSTKKCYATHNVENYIALHLPCINENDETVIGLSHQDALDMLRVLESALQDCEVSLIEAAIPDRDSEH